VKRFDVRVTGLLEDTDWADLGHAYGSAEDTPYLLAQLLDEDPDVQAHALQQLEMSLLHQGSLYSATPPAALYIATILTDPRTMAPHESVYPWDDRRRPLRAALVEWLALVAESTTEEDDDPDVEACRAIRPQIYAAVSGFLDDTDPAIREAALGAVSALAELADAEVFHRVLTTSTDRRERAAAVLSLGSRGEDTTSLLADPDPAIRACAALAPGCAENDEATRVILAALLDPETTDAWFNPPLPQFEGWFRFTLIAAAVDRVRTFEELLPAALALVPFGNEYTVGRDWGVLLVKAFPTPFDDGLTPAQRDFLTAVADNDRNWGNIANKDRWLHEAGLPVGRAELRRLIQTQG
jgi:hypothetical protein